MAIITNYFSVKSAIDFASQTDIWLEFAKNTAWTDEAHPDAENPVTSNLDSSQLFVKSNALVLVYPAADTDSADNVIIYKGMRWKPSSPTDAFTNNASYVLISYKIDAGTTDDFTWRQTGIREGVSPVDASNTKTILKPSEVSNKGNLLGFDNHKVQNYTNDVVTELEYLMKF